MRYDHLTTLSDYLRVLRRRSPILVLTILLVPSLAVAVSYQQSALYRSSAEVLLNQQDLATSLTGINNPSVYQDPARFIQTQVDLARLPLVANRVRKATGISFDLLAHSNVLTNNNSNILWFQVTAPSARVAARLATEYARQFTLYRSELDTAALVRAREEVARRLAQLRAAGNRTSALYTDLIKRDQQLGTLQALQTSNASLVRSADNAVKVRPRPVRTGVLGLGLGIAFGIALAFLWEALDTRVRTVDEVSHRLDLPLLGRVPEPPRRLRNLDKLVMLEEPRGRHGEIFRMLRTNVEFSSLECSARTIMITSGVGKEGKSTTAANLAVALARAERRVALVDLDLRRPRLAQLFGLDGWAGLTDVALGDVPLASALNRITLFESERQSSSSRNGQREVSGVLELLPAGPPPPDPGEFVGTRALAAVIEQLSERADYVLIDAPPLLQIGDAMTLSTTIDAILLVVRLKTLRRPMLNELRPLPPTTPVPKLGFVLTGTELDEEHYAGYYYDYDQLEYERERARSS